MSCWVVPTIAAELWGIPLEQVLGQIRAGVVVSKSDYGFTLVDVAPDSRELAPPPPRIPLAAPMTFVPATEFEAAEQIASRMMADVLAAAEPANVDIATTTPEPAVDLSPAYDDVPVSAEVLPAEIPQVRDDGSPYCDASSDEVAALTSELLPSTLLPVAPVPAAPEKRVAAQPVRVGKRRQATSPRPAAAPIEPLPSASDEDESEDGPDPNYGEPDDGKPLDWRAARARASTLRRRPPTRFN